MSKSRTADPRPGAPSGASGAVDPPETGPSESSSVARVREDAARRGLSIEPRRLADSTRTAEQAAAACGVTLDQIVKSIIFREAASDRHVLFLTAGGNRVDPALAADLAGAPLAKADAASVRATTGFAIGGVAPLGHLTPIDAWFDPRLLDFDVVWAAAGTPHHVFAVSPAALAAAIGATIAPFTP